MDERTFYALVADNYDLFYDFNAPGGRTDAEVDFLAWLLGDHAPAATRILDVACGTGRHLERLLRRGYLAAGFDLSEDMIGIASAKLRHQDLPEPLHIGDMRAIPAELGPVDAATMWLSAIAHMQTNADLLAALRSCRAVLRPGGLLVIETINYFWIMDKFRPTEDAWLALEDGFVHRHIERRVNTVPGTLTHEEFVSIHRGGRVEHRHYVSDLRGFSWPEFEGYLQQVGFVDVALYGDPSQRTPATTSAPRLLMTGRRPIT